MDRVSLFWRRLVAVVVAAVAVVAAACGAPVGSDRVKVVASIFPLADMVRQVGGDRVEVVTLLPPGVNPHTFEPSIGVVKEVARARLFVKVGAGMEFWADKIVEASGNPGLVTVDTSEGVALLQEDESRANPHFWLDVTIAMKQVGDIRDALMTVDPQNSGVYEKNAADYLSQLGDLDRWVVEETRSLSRREFISFHPTWSYFARRYGLNEAAVIEESPGKEPSPAYIKEVVDTARRLGVKAIFAEPQFNPQAAEAIAAESRARVVFLDSMGGPGIPGKDSYVGLMRYNVRQMVLALR